MSAGDVTFDPARLALPEHAVFVSALPSERGPLLIFENRDTRSPAYARQYRVPLLTALALAIADAHGAARIAAGERTPISETAPHCGL